MVIRFKDRGKNLHKNYYTDGKSTEFILLFNIIREAGGVRFAKPHFE